MSAQMVIIAAIGPHGELGFEGKIPWGLLKHDMERFKGLTAGQTVVMGSKTADGLGPGALPGRTKLILCDEGCNHCELGYVVKSLAMAMHKASEIGDGPLVVLGGGQVYKSAVAFAECNGIPTSIILTHVEPSREEAFTHDTRFPVLGNAWREVYKGQKFYDQVLKAGRCSESHFRTHTTIHINF